MKLWYICLINAVLENFRYYNMGQKAFAIIGAKIAPNAEISKN